MAYTFYPVFVSSRVKGQIVWTEQAIVNTSFFLKYPQFSQKRNLFTLRPIQYVFIFQNRNVSLHHLLTSGSSALNGYCQIRVQTADKNIIIQVYLKEIEYVEKVFFL